MASPSWEVPTPKATCARYASRPRWVTPAIAMPAGVVPASTATTVPRRVASAGKSWNQIPGSVLGARTSGGSLARPCGRSTRSRGVPGDASSGQVELSYPLCGVSSIGSLVWVPWALVCHAHGRILELGHCNRRYGNPWPQRHRSSHRDRGGRAMFAPTASRLLSAAQTAKQWCVQAPLCPGDDPGTRAGGLPTAGHVAAHLPTPVLPAGPPGGDATRCRWASHRGAHPESVCVCGVCVVCVVVWACVGGGGGCMGLPSRCVSFFCYQLLSLPLHLQDPPNLHEHFASKLYPLNSSLCDRRTHPLIETRCIWPALTAVCFP